MQNLINPKVKIFFISSVIFFSCCLLYTIVYGEETIENNPVPPPIEQPLDNNSLEPVNSSTTEKILEIKETPTSKINSIKIPENKKQKDLKAYSIRQDKTYYKTDSFSLEGSCVYFANIILCGTFSITKQN